MEQPIEFVTTSKEALKHLRDKGAFLKGDPLLGYKIDHYNTGKHFDRLCLIIKKELEQLEQKNKKLKAMASILTKFITDDQVFINLIANCFLIDGSINLSNDEIELIEELLNA